ncbi:MAG TPA: hypothetical protein VE860_14230 [Chthoniobacterales bacterium]|nr:hypothetical protein [Chthoniobacterales bacterium]
MAATPPRAATVRQYYRQHAQFTLAWVDPTLDRQPHFFVVTLCSGSNPQTGRRGDFALTHACEFDYEYEYE